ncbi:50S ribosomal protein L22 [uncultured archaeon]|nr:50S ribosomal protein L22 [uncultured archaeon]
MAYAYVDKEGTRTARARVTGINASYKDLGNVCSNVRGKGTEDAIEFLELAAKKKKAILYTRHFTGKGHRRELGGRIGGFPVKSVKFVLEVLKSAAANAIRLGLAETKVAHIIANKQDTYPRMSPKGRRIVHNYETAFIEVVLEERQAEAKKNAKADKQAAAKKEATAQPEAKKQGAAKTNEAKKQEAAKPSEKKEAPIAAVPVKS